MNYSTTKIAKQFNWHKTSNEVFGVYKGYCFNIFKSSLLSNS